MAVNLEKVSELFSGDINEIELFGLAFLSSDHILAINAVVFAHNLQKLKSSSVSGYTKFVVNELIGRVRLRYVFTHSELLLGIKKVIVINLIGTELA